MAYRFGRSPQIKQGVLPTLYLIGASATGLFYYAKNTLFLNYYKNYIQLQGNNGPIEPSEHLQNLLTDVKKDLKENASEHTPIVPFIMPGLNTLNGGTIGTTAGGIVGLPAFFEFSNEEDVANNILISGKKEGVPIVTTENNEDLYNCFLLSERAKKYGIAREILHINTFKVYIMTPLALTVAFSMDSISKQLVPKLGLNYQHPYWRGSYYVAMTFIGLGALRILYKHIRDYYDSEVESMITELGEEYITGGIEYYTKEMQRNSLNIDWPQKSSILYTVTEPFRSFLSYRQIPLVMRIVYLKSFLKKESLEPVQ